MIAVQPLAAQVGVAPACQALGVSRATFYRRQRSTPGRQQPRPTPARALCEAEREQILDVLAGPRFVDRAPAEVVATLLDEGHYLCSERTMYRILAADQPVRERRNQREHPQHTKPELVATAPNQTWSWDITKLLGPTKWTYFYLYVVLDIVSRYAVGWMVADRENSALAGRLIEETCHKQGVQPQVLTLHSDRGAPMTSKCTAQLLADLGVTRSLSRPQVSDDNPFSEAQFKTLKYHPGFRSAVDEAFGVKGPGGLQGTSALSQHIRCSVMMDIIGGEHRDPAMAVLGVVPGEERPAEGDGGGNVFEAPREWQENLTIPLETLADGLLVAPQPRRLAPAALFGESIVEGREALGTRDGDQEVPPDEADQSLDLALVVALARPAEPVLEQIVGLKLREDARSLPLPIAQDPGNRQLGVLVQDGSGDAAEEGKRRVVAIAECFGRLRRIGRNKATITVGKVEGKEVDLP